MSAPWMEEREWMDIEPQGTVVPAEGFRFWFIDQRNMMLVPAVSQAQVDLFTKPDWLPHEVNEAHCGNGSETDTHLVPSLSCNCGFAALNHWDPRPARHSGGVVGKVDLWGRTIVGDLGYRAQFAKPSSFIHLTCRACQSVLAKDAKVHLEQHTHKRLSWQRVVASVLYCDDCANRGHYGGRDMAGFLHWEGTARELLESLSEAYDLPVEEPEQYCNHSRLEKWDDDPTGVWRCRQGCGSQLNVMVLGRYEKEHENG
jgi:hypothetical protein